MKKEITIDRTREAAILKAAEEEFLTKGYAYSHSPSEDLCKLNHVAEHPSAVVHMNIR